jgi:hypothetical protein
MVRKPRVTTRKKNDLEGNKQRGRGLYSWQSGEGERLDGDEVSPLYKIAVSLWA